MIAYPLPSASSEISSNQRSFSLDTEVPPAGRFVIALVGLAFEARIAAGPGVFVICRDAENEVAASLDRAIKRGCRSVISFGVAGGLAPHLRTGDWIVASSIIDAQQNRPTDRIWSEKMLEMIPAPNTPALLASTLRSQIPRPSSKCTSRQIRKTSTWNRITSRGSHRPTG